MEATGKNGRYYTLKLMVDARKIMRQAEIDELSELPESFGPLVDAYEALVDEAKQHAETGFSEEQGGGVDAHDLSSIAGDADDFMQSAKELWRRKRDGNDWDRTERRRLGTSAGWMVDGSPDEMRRDYNDLVDSYNRL